MAESIITGVDVLGHPSQDPDTLAARAVAAIRDYCGWHVAPVLQETVTVESDGSGVVFLPTLRVVSVDAVEVDGVPVTVARRDWSQYGWLRVSAEVGVPVAVTLTHGYDVTESLKAAALTLAQAAKSPDDRLIRSQRLGDAQIDYVSASAAIEAVRVPGSARTTLDRYVLPARP